MEKLLEQAQQLVATLREKIASVKEKEATLADELGKAKGIQSSQEVYAAELAGREVECQKVENVQTIMTNAKNLVNDLEADREKFRGDVEKLEAEKKQVAQQKRDNAHEQELITKGNDLLRKGNADLKVAQQNMKERILEELKAKV